MAIPLRAGRDLAPTGDERAPPVVVVSASLARRLGGASVVGRRLTSSNGAFADASGAPRPVRLLTVLGVLGVALAALGIHGVLAYAVSRRTREVGVRLALGASAREAVGVVVLRSLRPVVVGLAAGGWGRWWQGARRRASCSTSRRTTRLPCSARPRCSARRRSWGASGLRAAPRAWTPRRRSVPTDLLRQLAMPDDRSTQDEAKRVAAGRAVDLVRSGMVLGLGTGSTAALAVAEIGRRLADGRLRDLVGVPTSEATERQARALGIPLSTLDHHPRLDLTIDGADEVDPARRLIKGAGGALLREKIVAAASRRLAIVVDRSKLVDRLGTRYPVPVEVTPFGWTTHLEPIRALGGEPVLRSRDGAPYRTDGGNMILDVRFAEGLDDPERVAAELKARVGVVETGLFLGFAPEVIVGES